MAMLATGCKLAIANRWVGACFAWAGAGFKKPWGSVWFGELYVWCFVFAAQILCNPLTLCFLAFIDSLFRFSCSYRTAQGRATNDDLEWPKF